ncbi:hypothetical protein Vqi01_39750 [Micromonospora qiuiae]|uniref:Uncharacterized protein n=1 Tax=Micromonospora qiuiae TaxID=502268 RepID=A0ABQ4JF05_9ACTN|nr:hypothetical protein Vqi01_39750 [Micromonospora qiuiae]
MTATPAHCLPTANTLLVMKLAAKWISWTAANLMIEVRFALVLAAVVKAGGVGVAGLGPGALEGHGGFHLQELDLAG